LCAPRSTPVGPGRVSAAAERSAAAACVEHLLPPGNQCNASVPYAGRIRDYDEFKPEAVVGKMLSSRGVLRYMYEARLLPSKRLQLHSPIVQYR
jgi:hypothetical protein